MTPPKKLLVTGCCGLVGAETVAHFDARGWRVFGVDNNLRRYFFGPRGDTAPARAWLARRTRRFTHYDLDVRDAPRLERLFLDHRPDAVVHCASQPSHDWARRDPLTDFSVNALATLQLLETVRRHAPEAPFVLLSTNKVYGDNPNRLPLQELETRYDYADPADYEGISEACSLDGCLHSLFGVSKATADLLTQEYGRTFQMPTVSLRAGCITGPNHAGVELHGFLSYLVATALEERSYTVYGYKGKQVRDQLHARDLVEAIAAVIADPAPGEAFNVGGGRASNASLRECVALVEERLGRPLARTYVDEPRLGDHVCYISDTRKFRRRYPQWQPRHGVADMVDELIEAAEGEA